MFSSAKAAALLALAATASATSVLFPLYIYPTSTSTWDPLYSAISSNPDVAFTVVVNPDSGPGGTSPNSDYTPALQQLNSYSNVQTIGYIDSQYGAQDASALEAEVDEYAAWPEDVRPTGVFWDDVTQSDESGSWEILQTASEYAQSQGLSTIVFNPGTIPADDTLYGYGTQTIISEIPYSEYASQSAAIAAIDVAASELSIILLSVPSDTDLSSVVSTFVDRGYGSVYFTDLDGYTSFSDDLDTFVSDVASA